MSDIQFHPDRFSLVCPMPETEAEIEAWEKAVREEAQKIADWVDHKIYLEIVEEHQGERTCKSST